jgi:hypothetical protein
MSIIIDPKWTFIETLQAARAAYPGGIQFGTPNRVRALERWANVVGQERAVYELDILLNEYPSLKEASKAFGMSVSTLRRIRSNFKAMPTITPFSSEPSKIEEQIASLKEAKGETEITEQALNKFIELTKKIGINPISKVIEIFTQKEIDLSIYESTLFQVLEINQKAGINVVARLFDWITKTAKVEDVLTVMESLDFDDLQRLNVAVGLSNLKSVLSIWQLNKENDDEEFWQKIFSQNHFIFAQLFSFPVLLIEDKAYIGGKNFRNKNGNIVDFLCANNLTKSAALIEIKTPKTKLLGSQYRGDIYNISSELSGSVIQTANYKKSLLENYTDLTKDEERIFNVFNPKSIIIIGNIKSELTDKKKNKSFELFRSGLNDVQIITYDELFGKVQFIIDLLEGNINKE